MGYCSETLASAAITNGERVLNVPSRPVCALNVHNVSYGYGKATENKLALDRVSFRLHVGRFHGLLGPNGAGKSTLFALLTRLFVPGSGNIHLFDRDLRASPTQVLANIGVVFQQTTLDLDLSVEQNLLYHGALHGLTPGETRRRLKGELEAFALADRLKDKVRRLNGGHRRRLELVRALLHQPKILLLDEPTVGLDLESRQYLNRRVRQLCVERGLSVLWATHLMEEVQDEDRVILLHNGKVAAEGECRQLYRDHHIDNATALFNQFTGQVI